jgi:hypothetical protein
VFKTKRNRGEGQGEGQSSKELLLLLLQGGKGLDERARLAVISAEVLVIVVGAAAVALALPQGQSHPVASTLTAHPVVRSHDAPRPALQALAKAPLSGPIPVGALTHLPGASHASAARHRGVHHSAVHQSAVHHSASHHGAGQASSGHGGSSHGAGSPSAPGWSPVSTGSSGSSNPVIAQSAPPSSPAKQSPKPTKPTQQPKKPTNSGSGNGSARPTSPSGGGGAVPGVNLARGATMTASGSTQVYVPANANDGNPSTYWESTDNAFPQWLDARLSSVQTVRSIVLRVPPSPLWLARTQTISVLGSQNGTSWTTLKPSAGYDFKPASDNTVTIDLPASRVQYVRLFFTGNTDWPAGQISEFEIFSGS